ncbi:MAG: hypothetical protein ABIR66_02225 [Saprospiraceae bacterium]
MRFIPGFKFTVSPAKAKISSPSLLQARQVRVRADDTFQLAHEYELEYIRPSKEAKIVYHFTDRTTNEKFSVEFNSLAEADRKLEKISGSEPFIPVYESET